MMKLTAHLTEGYLDIDGAKLIRCSSNVRNEINGLRKPHEIVYSIPARKPYQPRSFPVGTWKVYPSVEKDKIKDPYLYPIFIPTNAYRDLPVWSIKDGKYESPTDETVRDYGYGLHYSTSLTTLGCIRIHTEADIRMLAKLVDNALRADEEVILEVL
jgi:hypothetical protein